MAELTDESESTSMAEIKMGRSSRSDVSASSVDLDGSRMVAKTVWPARANASAVSRPIPLLAPVIRTDAIGTSLNVLDQCVNCQAGGASLIRVSTAAGKPF